MAKRAVSATKEFLIAAALPTHEDTYTVIPHEFVIAETINNLKAQGFGIKQELYRCNQNANIAQGIYHLDYSDDPEMGMMFAWSNSYDKSMRFKCAVGGVVLVCMNGMVSGNMGTWGRKHTGSADSETTETIQAQIHKAKQYYKQLVYDKETMKTIQVSKKVQAELVGRLYFEEDLLNTEQLTVIKHQLHTPKYDYNADKDSLWALYNHITLSLHKAHPKEWLDHQRLVHWFFTQEYGIKPLVLVESTPAVAPVRELEVVTTEEKAVISTVITEEKAPVIEPELKQIDLEDAIKDIESEGNLNHL